MQLCSSTFMYNLLQNDSDKILVFDMRSMIHFLSGHINHNQKNDTSIPVPPDIFESEDKFSIDLLKSEVLNNPHYKELQIMNDTKISKFDSRRRWYIFIIATHDQDLDQIDLSKLFQKTENPSEDLQTLRNAIILLDCLKRERVHREVYLLKDSMSTFT